MTSRTSTKTTTTLSIQIPEGASPGDILELQIQKPRPQVLEWTVPMGSEPGDVFEIQVGEEEGDDAFGNGAEDDDEEDEDDDHDDDDVKDHVDAAVASKDDTTNTFVSIEIDSASVTTLKFALQLPADYHHQQRQLQQEINEQSIGNDCKANEPDKSSAMNHHRQHEQQQQQQEEEDDATDGTFQLPWQSGILLAQNWDPILQHVMKMRNHNSNKDDDDNSSHQPNMKRILELGSGLGLGGISLAANMLIRSRTKTPDSTPDSTTPSHQQDNNHRVQWISPDAEIVLTDLPSAIPLLEFNIHQLHQSFFVSSKLQISTRVLRWSIESDDHDHHHEHSPDSEYSGNKKQKHHHPYDCIVGSDLLYNVEEIPNLVATMRRLLDPLRGIVILSVRWRKPELEREFFLNSGLDWELIPLPTSCCQLTWKEFGNPDCEKSNKYFHQRQISVNGRLTSIATIDEEQARMLPKEEYEEWERSFIQILVGRTKGN